MGQRQSFAPAMGRQPTGGGGAGVRAAAEAAASQFAAVVPLVSGSGCFAGAAPLGQVAIGRQALHPALLDMEQ
eukprot:9594801-Lingulodinium_polyedra.AAC.1